MSGIPIHVLIWKTLKSCYLKWGPRTLQLGTTCQLIYRCGISGPTPDLQNQKLCFNQILKGLVCTASLDWISIQCWVPLSTRVLFFKICAPQMMERALLTCPMSVLSAWWSVLMSLCSWWKCGSHWGVLRERNRGENHCACFWPWPQPDPSGFHNVWLYLPSPGRVGDLN